MIKIILISDTHNHQMNLPDGDILIHCGDLTMSGTVREFQQAEAWFRGLKRQFKRIFYVCGNHDSGAYTDHRVIRQDVLKTPIWLVDEEVESLDGIRIYGSPWTPGLAGCGWWAYPLQNKDKWDEIPEGLDILVTHGPPLNIMDSHWHTGYHFGDSYLRKRLKEMKQPPRLHVFGHNHDGHGHHEEDGIHFFNAAICDEDYNATQKPIVVEYDKGVISYAFDS